MVETKIPEDKQIMGLDGKIHHLDDLYTIPDIREMLLPEVVVSYNQLHGWSTKGTTDFPPVVKVLGRYNFYDLSEVKEWVTLWLRATKNMRMNNNGFRFKERVES